MFNFKKKFSKFDTDWRSTFVSGLNNPKIRKSAISHAYWMDHEILRKFYHNDHEICAGVFRSNQPSPYRIKLWHRRGIKTIINFRGESDQAAFLLEKEACEKFDIDLINFQLYATKLPTRQKLLDLEHIFSNVPHPFLMHCKSGSDRAGLGSALYFIYVLDAPIEVAQRQLSIKYLHLGGWTAGILDFMLMQYRLAFEKSGIVFKHWVKTEYDELELTHGFLEFRKKNHFFKIPR